MDGTILARVKRTILISLLACFCLACPVSSAQTTQRSLLLVCGGDAPLESLTHAEIRKVFLGVPVTRNKERLRPLLNSTDSLATNIFLQQVIFMSEREYRRQILSRVFRFGDQRPREYDDIEQLVEDLRNTPGSLSYMWSDQFENHTELKLLSILWTSSSN